MLAASIALGVSLLVGLYLSGCAKPDSKQDKVSAGGANLVAMDDGADVDMPHTRCCIHGIISPNKTYVYIHNCIA